MTNDETPVGGDCPHGVQYGSAGGCTECERDRFRELARRGENLSFDLFGERELLRAQVKTLNSTCGELNAAFLQSQREADQWVLEVEKLREEIAALNRIMRDRDAALKALRQADDALDTAEAHLSDADYNQAAFAAIDAARKVIRLILTA